MSLLHSKLGIAPTPAGLLHLLTTADLSEHDRLMAAAREVAVARFGHTVYLRGLIEVSNICRNDCLYCGIRRSNREVARYRLTADEIWACCEEGQRLGFHTFVLQGGEDGHYTPEAWAAIVRGIKQRIPGCAVTLSLGEMSDDAYALLREAGADRYLLRHETINPDHYAQLHPTTMSYDNRRRCLYTLQRLGFQTGTGVMVGSPGQRPEHLVEDLLFMQEFRPEMIGIGPFLPHHATPFAHEPAGSVETTLRMVALCRLLVPDALIPATTALSSVPGANGRTAGVLAGANVVMPNLSPLSSRQRYTLYDGKLSSGNESAQNLVDLATEMCAIGYTTSLQRGDHPAHTHSPHY